MKVCTNIISFIELLRLGHNRLSSSKRWGYIDEIDLELVNQELNFTSADNSLQIRGGCELFTTKPIASDRKLFKTIDKHLDQIIEDNIISRSLEKERQNSISSLFGTSGSPQDVRIQEQSQLQHPQQQQRQRRSSSTSTKIQFHKSVVPDIKDPEHTPNASLLSKSLNATDDSFSNDAEQQQDEHAIDDSPFGPLKNTTTRRTFAYLIGILNHTFPDQDFSDLQPTHDFIKVPVSDLLTKFDNLLMSLGKKSDVLHWMWDILDSYMEVLPSKTSSPYLAAQDTETIEHHSEISTNRKNSVNNGSSRQGSPPNSKAVGQESCSIYSFEPANDSIFEDIAYPYQPMWSYFWFIYNKKRKRVAFIRLIAINKADLEEEESDTNNGGDEDVDVVGSIEIS
ncbi:MAF1 [Candida theae]|uniref:MAF1 n=1 Tax=Candida theae TaxID=1198502 RepID=A0AAD5BBF8_9ASCO|nr:MAF1 [Candida theae]KAI5950469.1 MAF1 [Candida theae]